LISLAFVLRERADRDVADLASEALEVIVVAPRQIVDHGSILTPALACV